MAAEATTLPFSDGSFDVVLCAHMLYHVTERLKTARELRRVLARSGICVAVTNGEDNQRELVRLVEDVVGHGWKWRRPSETFSLENGASQLQVAFDEVRRVDCPSGIVEIRDPQALADYLASAGDYYEQEIASWTSWPSVVEQCREKVAAVVNETGYFGISSSMGAFVCS